MARDPSKYVIDGVRVPSVTEVLHINGLDDWSMVDPVVLEAARQRGQAVHEWTELLDQGFLTPEDRPDEPIAGYVEAYIRFKNETGFSVEQVEQVVLNETYRYAGMLDRTGKLNGKRALLDLKAVRSVTPATALQTAGYGECLEEHHERYALQLRPDGTYRLTHYADRGDRHDFLSAVRLAWWRLNHGEKL